MVLLLVEVGVVNMEDMVIMVFVVNKVVYLVENFEFIMFFLSGVLLVDVIIY